MAEQVWVVLVEGGSLKARHADGSVTLFLRDAVVLDERVVDASWQVLLRTIGGVQRLRIALDDRISIDRLKRLPRDPLSDAEREALLVRMATADAATTPPTLRAGSITFDGSFLTVVVGDEEHPFLVGHVPLPTVLSSESIDDGSLDVRLALPGRGDVTMVRVAPEGRHEADRALLVCRTAVARAATTASGSGWSSSAGSSTSTGAASVPRAGTVSGSPARGRALVLAAIVEPLAWLGVAVCVVVGLSVAASSDGFGQRQNVGEGLTILFAGSFQFLVVAMLAAYVQSHADD